MKRLFSLPVILIFFLISLSTINGFGEMDISTESQNKDMSEDSMDIQEEVNLQKYKDLQKFENLSDLLQFIEMYYIKDVDEKELLNSAAKGMLEYLQDDSSKFYFPDEFKWMFENNSNTVGIGVLLHAQKKDNSCVVVNVYSESPAKKAGIKKGDILYKVDDFGPITSVNLQEAVNRIRGAEGTQVEITVLRDNTEKFFMITRAPVDTNPVVSKMLTKDIGYIEFLEIVGNCSEQFEEDLQALLRMGVRGVIIDMRGNQGGWIDEATRIADLFLDKEVIGGYIYKDGEVDNQDFETKDGKHNVKIVVLVNEYTASAAELLASALREKANAKLVGTRTYGMGTVSGIYPFGTDGAGYQLGIAELIDINDEKIDGNGLIPDVEAVLETADETNDEIDVQLQMAIEVMKDELERDGR